MKIKTTQIVEGYIHQEPRPDLRSTSNLAGRLIELPKAEMHNIYIAKLPRYIDGRLYAKIQDNQTICCFNI